MINWTALIVFIALFVLVTGLGFVAAHVAEGRPDHAARVGPRRAPLRYIGHLVPASAAISIPPTPSLPFPR